MELALNVIKDLDVLVERSISDVTKPLERRVDACDTGRIDRIAARIDIGSHIAARIDRVVDRCETVAVGGVRLLFHRRRRYPTGQSCGVAETPARSWCASVARRVAYAQRPARPVRPSRRLALATVRQCRTALDGLAKTLDEVDPDLRIKHVPSRTVMCRLTDLEVTFTARLDPDGVHDIKQLRRGTEAGVDADVKLALESDELLALATGEEDFLTAWLRGRVHISASVRDMLRLRSLGGL